MMFKFRFSIIFTLLALLYVQTASAELHYNYDDTNGTASVSGCSNVSGAITIPSIVSRVVDKKIRYYTVTEIGEFAFFECYDLTSVNIPSTVKKIGEWSFRFCTSLTSVNMPSVISVGPFAFAQCFSLTSISMPSVKSIGHDAFYCCSNLTSVSMPSVEYIEGGAFMECTSLISVSLPSVTTIYGNAFENCSSLISVSMPSVKSIGYDAFWGCSSLISVSMPSVTSIDHSAFWGCSSLISVSMPSVKSIESDVFWGCSNLTSVSMPSVESIGQYAFGHCSSLISVSMPSVKSIEFEAFWGCSDLISVSMPSVKSIESYAFCDCNSLSELTLPSSIESIEYEAFPVSIKTIICNATTPPSGSGVSNYEQPHVYLIVPDGCTDKYRNSEDWMNFYIEEKLSIAPSRDMCGGWNNIQYSSDDSSFSESTTPSINGMTADGYSQIVIYKKLSKDIVDTPKVTFYNSNNSELKDEAITGKVTSLQQIDDDVYGIYITAPVVSASNNYLFNSSGYYLYSVKIEFNDNESGMCNINVYRPGVLLIHGLNDSANKCWNDMQRYLTSNMYSPCQVLGVDYTSSNKESFNENTHDREIVFNAVQQIYNTLLYENGIVSSKYDLVGHSMGGILSRLYAQEVDKESVNRIITVNTPHWGSEGANNHVADFIASGFDPYYIKAHVLKINDYRAYDDLRTESPAIINLNSKNCSSIPVHAVCSYLSGLPEDSELEKTVSKTAYAVSSNTFFSYLEGYLAKASMGFANDKLYKSIFKGNDSDGVVSLPSQRGGLSYQYCTIEHSPFKGPLGQESDAYHTKTTHWNETIGNVAKLLYEPYTSSMFSTSGYSYTAPAMSPMRNQEANAAGSDAPDMSDSRIDINVSLTDSIEPGYRIVRSVISYSDDIQSTLAFSILNDDEVLVSLNQDTAYFAIPETFSGDLIFDVLGMVDENNHIGALDTIHFDNQARPILLLSDNHNIYMCKGQRSVPGTRIVWSNGFESSDSIDFISSDDNVIRMDNGYVCAVEKGTAMLIAEYAGLSDTINVTVLDYEATAPVSAITAQQLFTVSNSDDRLTIDFKESYSGQLSVRIYGSSGSSVLDMDNYVSYSAGTEHSVPLDLPSGVYVALISTKVFTVSYKFYRN